MEKKNPCVRLGRWKINAEGNTISFTSPGPMSWWTRLWNAVYYATIFRITRKGLKVAKVEPDNLRGYYEVVMYHGRLEITKEVKEVAMRTLVRTLTEEQINWIIQQIRDNKESEYTGEDYAGIMENWDIEDYEGISQDEMDFLEGLYNAVR